MAPIERGEAYGIDTADVHTLLVKLIMGNETAEMKIKSHELLRNGRTDWIALKEQYEVIGIYAFDVTEADTIITGLFYSILFYSILFYSILFYSILFRRKVPSHVLGEV